MLFSDKKENEDWARPQPAWALKTLYEARHKWSNTAWFHLCKTSGIGKSTDTGSWLEVARSFWTVVLEKTLENPLDCKEIQPVHPKGDQSWIFIAKTDTETEAPILWPPDAKSWLIGKDPDAGKDWRQEKGMTEDETVGWHQQLNGHEFDQASGVGDGQGSLVCWSPWGHKESDRTELLNWTELH